MPWRAEAALVHAALGNTGEARRLAGEQLELARAFGRPRTLGISLRACGLVEGGETGLELLATRPSRRWSARSHRSSSPARYPTTAPRCGAPAAASQARAELERALDLAHHCGARRIANQARAELIAAGAKPRRDAITGRDALTAGELRVARLAAEGLTNREIAQALFITTKTAKAHLSRVYRKLDDHPPRPTRRTRSPAFSATWRGPERHRDDHFLRPRAPEDWTAWPMRHAPGGATLAAINVGARDRQEHQLEGNAQCRRSSSVPTHPTASWRR